MLRFDRKQQNSVKQLSFNRKFKRKKKGVTSEVAGKPKEDDPRKTVEKNIT